jgi:hypothetical protein
MDDRPEILETTLSADEEQPPRRRPMTTQKVKRPATMSASDAAASADSESDKPKGPQAYRRKANRPVSD